MNTAYEYITHTMEQENLTIKEIAKKIGIAPYMLLRKVTPEVDIKASSWMEIMQAMEYRIVLVPRNSEQETFWLDEEMTPLKALNQILILSNVKLTEIATQLGISRQAVAIVIKKNNDILSSRLIQISNILGYDVVLEKHKLESI